MVISREDIKEFEKHGLEKRVKKTPRVFNRAMLGEAGAPLYKGGETTTTVATPPRRDEPGVAHDTGVDHLRRIGMVKDDGTIMRPSETSLRQPGPSEFEYKKELPKAIGRGVVSGVTGPAEVVDLTAGNVERIARRIAKVPKESEGRELLKAISGGPLRGIPYVSEKITKLADRLRGSTVLKPHESVHVGIEKGYNDPKWWVTHGTEAVPSLAIGALSGALGALSGAGKGAIKTFLSKTASKEAKEAAGKILAKEAKKGVFASTAAMEGGSQHAGFREFLASQDKTIDDATATQLLQDSVGSAVTGVLAGKLETFGIERLAAPVMNRLFGEASKKASKEFWKRFVKEVPAGVVSEGGTEGLQQVISNIATKMGYNPDQEWSEGVLDAMAIGGMVGGGVSGIGSMFKGKGVDEGPPPATEEKTPAEEIADKVDDPQDPLSVEDIERATEMSDEEVFAEFGVERDVIDNAYDEILDREEEGFVDEVEKEVEEEEIATQTAQDEVSEQVGEILDADEESKIIDLEKAGSDLADKNADPMVANNLFEAMKTTVGEQEAQAFKKGFDDRIEGIKQEKLNETAEPELMEGIKAEPQDYVNNLQRELNKNFREEKGPEVQVKIAEPKGTDKIYEKMASLFGKKFVRVSMTSETGDTFGGVFSKNNPDVVFVSDTNKDPALYVLGHEMNHALKNEGEVEYQNFYEIAKSLITDETLKGRIEQFEQFAITDGDAYRDADGVLKHTKGPKKDTEYRVSENQAVEEVISDFVGTEFTNTEFWGQLKEKDPTTFQTIVKVVNNIINKILRNGGQIEGSEEVFKDLKAVQAAFKQYVDFKVLNEETGEIEITEEAAPTKETAPLSTALEEKTKQEIEDIKAKQKADEEVDRVGEELKFTDADGKTFKGEITQDLGENGLVVTKGEEEVIFRADGKSIEGDFTLEGAEAAPAVEPAEAPAAPAPAKEEPAPAPTPAPEPITEAPPVGGVDQIFETFSKQGTTEASITAKVGEEDKRLDLQVFKVGSKKWEYRVTDPATKEVLFTDTTTTKTKAIEGMEDFVSSLDPKSKPKEVITNKDIDDYIERKELSLKDTPTIRDRVKRTMIFERDMQDKGIIGDEGIANYDIEDVINNNDYYQKLKEIVTPNDNLGDVKFSRVAPPVEKKGNEPGSFDNPVSDYKVLTDQVTMDNYPLVVDNKTEAYKATSAMARDLHDKGVQTESFYRILEISGFVKGKDNTKIPVIERWNKIYDPFRNIWVVKDAFYSSYEISNSWGIPIKDYPKAVESNNNIIPSEKDIESNKYATDNEVSLSFSRGFRSNLADKFSLMGLPKKSQAADYKNTIEVWTKKDSSLRDEYEFTYLGEWLDEQGDRQISREEIYNAIQENEVRFDVKDSGEISVSGFQELFETDYFEDMYNSIFDAHIDPDDSILNKDTISEEFVEIFGSEKRYSRLTPEERTREFLSSDLGMYLSLGAPSVTPELYTDKVLFESDDYRVKLVKYSPKMETYTGNGYEHHMQSNVLSHFRASVLEDGRYFLNEMQSDWHSDKESPKAPWKKTWPLLTFKNALADAVLNSDSDRIAWPITGEDITKIQGWGKEAIGTVNADRIIKHYATDLRNQVDKFVKRYGSEVNIVDGRFAEVEITPEFRQLVEQDELPKFSRKTPKPKALNPDVQKQIDDSMGVDGFSDAKSLLSKIKRWARGFASSRPDMVRPGFGGWVESVLKGVKDRGSLKNMMRLSKEVFNYSTNEAWRRIYSTVGNLNTNQRKLFAMNLVLADLYQDTVKQRDGVSLLNSQTGYPFGIRSAAELKRELINIRKQAQEDPAVMAALRARKKGMIEIQKQLVYNGIMPIQILSNPDFFHRQVIETMSLKGTFKELYSGKDPKRNYNTDYVESEFMMLSNYIASVELTKYKKRIRDEFDIRGDLEAKAKKKGVSWQSLIPEGYSLWNPSRDSAWNTGATVPERIMVEAVNTTTGIPVEQIEDVLGANLNWVLPNDVAMSMDKFEKDVSDQAAIAQASRMLVNGWKKWILANPYRVVKYNFNNMMGDMDIAMSYDPRILLNMKQAFRDLASDVESLGVKIVPWQKKVASKHTQELKDELQLAHKLGVIGSGFVVHEIQDVNREFRMMTNPHTNPAMKWWQWSKDATNMRENILRLAAFRYFRARLQKGDTNVYGASKQVEIDAITKIDEKAAKLARDLIGDYGNLSQSGEWMRSNMMPFYSWVEINAPRFVRLMRNAKYEGNRDTLFAGATWKTTKAAAKMMAFMTLVQMWNSTFFDEEEKELTEEQQRAMHIILGRRDDGSVRYIRFTGAFRDALDWFDLGDAPDDYNDIKTGKSTIGDKIGEAAKAPVNRAIQGSRPFLSGAMQYATGKSFFPDFFNQRPIKDRSEFMFRMFSLNTIYNYTTGKPTKNGGFEELLPFKLINTADPGESAFFHIRNKKFEYLKEQGKTVSFSESKGKVKDKRDALYYYRRSMQLGDYKTAAKFLRQYSDNGGTVNGLRTSVKLASPSGGIPKKHKKGFYASLNEEDKKKLNLATKWYRDVYGRDNLNRVNGILKQISK